MVKEKLLTTVEEVRRAGDEIGVDGDRLDLEQFRAGMDVEFEHGGYDLILTGKIAPAHVKESPDYYERLGQEVECERA
jgi:hypothetical protein